MLIHLLRDLPITMLVSTHDMRLVKELFPRTIVMNERRIVADGLTRGILENEKLLEAHGLERMRCFWRVRANGAYGPGEWSVTFSFTTTP